MIPFQPGAPPVEGVQGPLVVSARFEAIEIDLLRLAVTQLVDMLDAATTDPQSALTDPAFQRLLPDAYRDDAEAAAEFRRFTSDDLLAAKVRNARTVLESLRNAPGHDSPGFASGEPDTVESNTVESDTAETAVAEQADPGPVFETDAAASVERDNIDTAAITLDAGAVQAWLRTLTDLRLTLAERLLIGADGDMRLAGAEASFLGGLYDWLGMVQESLVYAIDA